MRFLHTSDWHLGRQLFGESLLEDQAHALSSLLDLVRDTRPDAIVVAGDIYDRALPPAEAVELLDDTLSRLLIDCAVPVILIAGNHDSPQRLAFGNRLFARQKLYVAGTPAAGMTAVPIADEFGTVYFIPLPYAEPAAVRAAYPEAEAADHDQAVRQLIAAATAALPAGSRRVAIAHAFLAGGEGSESERPLTVGGSSVVGCDAFSAFHYTALGHLHRPQTAGSPLIRYSGSLLKYSFAEAGHEKGTNLVHMDADGRVEVTVCPLTPRRDVTIIRGLFDDLLRQPPPGTDTQSYLSAVLLDDGPVIDAMSRLRAVYPHLLHIEFAYREPAGAAATADRPHTRQLSDLDLFRAFSESTAGRPLTGEQETALADLLDEIRREEREA